MFQRLYQADLLYLYAKNYNLNIYISFAVLLLAPFLKYYFLPWRLGSELLPVLILATGSCLFAYLFKQELKYILANPLIIKSRFSFSVFTLAFYKSLLILSFLSAVFWPLDTNYLYDHLVSHGLAVCLLIFFVVLSSAYFPFLLLDVVLISGFVCLIATLNYNSLEQHVVLGVLCFVIVFAIIIGVILRNSTISLLNNQRKLQKARDEKEKAYKAKSDFLAVMSHEIRTPMNGIVGMLDFIQETKLAPRQKEYIETIDHCSKVLLNTLNDILDISKIDAGKMTIERVDIHLPSLLQKIKAIFEQNAVQKGLDFTVKIAPDTPEYIRSDPNRLYQIVSNLLNNALKFTHDGFIQVSVSYDQKKKHLLFEIKDSGIGVKEEELKHIFDSFSQADQSISRKYGGTGLGLSIVQNLIKMMGGEIWIKSQEYEGSTFCFYIPYIEGDAANIQEESVTSSRFGRLKGKTILIVDDNIINSQIAERHLKREGASVIKILTGKDTVRMAKKRTFDLIMMDIHMPDMNGYQIAKEIRGTALNKNTPIVGFSADVLRETYEKCKQMGMVGHISKPIDRINLINEVTAIFEGKPKKTIKVKQTVNKTTISSIREEFGPVYTRQLVLDSLKDIRKGLISANNFIYKKKVKMAAEDAHNLITLCGNIGMAESSDMAKQLEDICQTGSLKDAQDALMHLRMAIDHEEIQLKNWLAAAAEQAA